MDPVSAFGLATGVLTVATYAYEIVAKTIEISSSAQGVLSKNHDAAICALELLKRNESLERRLYDTSRHDPQNEEEKSLLRLGHECNIVAKDLVSELNCLRSSNSESLRKNLRAALKASMKKEKVDGMAAQMKLFQDHMNSVLLQMLLVNLQGLFTETSQGLQSNNFNIERVLTAVKTLQIATTDGRDAQTNYIQSLLGAQKTEILDSISVMISNTLQLTATQMGSKAVAITPQSHSNSFPGIGGSATSIHIATAQNNTARVLAILRADPVQLRSYDNKGRTALHHAAMNDNISLISVLLNKGAAINDQDDKLQTPLHLAILAGSPRTARLLLQRGADLNVFDQDGKTPKMLHGDTVDEISWILKNGHDLNTKDAYGDTALTHFAGKGDVGVVKSLIAQGVDCSIHGAHDRTALGAAMVCAQLEDQSFFDVATLLLECGVDVNAEGGAEEMPALHEAVSHGNMERTKFLLLHGANVNSSSKTGIVALYVAAKLGKLDIAQLLLAKSADLNVVSAHGHTPIAAACTNEHEDMVSFLLTHGADPNKSVGKSSAPPLLCAIQQGNLNICKILLSNSNTDVNQRDYNILTPLSMAVSRKHYAIVKLLLDHGADPNLQGEWEACPLSIAVKGDDKKACELLLANESLDINAKDGCLGLTAVQMACSYGKLDLLDLFHSHGADYTSTTNRSESLLFLAVSGDHFEVCKKLLAHGRTANINIDAPDEEGTTPLHRAARICSVQIVRLLLEHGANHTLRNDDGKTPAQTIACGGGKPWKECKRLLSEWDDQVKLKQQSSGSEDSTAV